MVKSQIHWSPSYFQELLIIPAAELYSAFTNVIFFFLCWPEIDNLPHDLWVGLICYWFGKIYYVDEELYYWIRYQTSVTGAGTKWSGMRYRVKESLQGKSYPNVSQYLLSEYEDLLTKKDRVFLEMLSSYKRNIITRLKLIFDKDFRRDTLKGTAIFKTGVLLGWL